MSEIIAYKKDDKIFDLQTATEQSIDTSDFKAIYLDDSTDALHILRHSTAHLMAQAIKSLYTNAKFFVGPVVNEGFYYDFKVDEKITHEDLTRIEEKMRLLAKQNDEIRKACMNRAQAEQKFKGDELKVAVMSKIDGDNFSTYTQGDFEDLCRGPHIPLESLTLYFIV